MTPKTEELKTAIFEAMRKITNNYLDNLRNRNMTDIEIALAMPDKESALIYMRNKTLYDASVLLSETNFNEEVFVPLLNNLRMLPKGVQNDRPDYVIPDEYKKK